MKGCQAELTSEGNYNCNLCGFLWPKEEQRPRCEPQASLDYLPYDPGNEAAFRLAYVYLDRPVERGCDICMHREICTDLSEHYDFTVDHVNCGADGDGDDESVGKKMLEILGNMKLGVISVEASDEYYAMSLPELELIRSTLADYQEFLVDIDESNDSANNTVTISEIGECLALVGVTK